MYSTKELIMNSHPDEKKSKKLKLRKDVYKEINVYMYTKINK